MILVLSSLALHFVTVYAYSRKPDILATYTVFPFWMWCLLGILLSSAGFLFFKRTLALCVATLWVFTMLLGSDEASAIANMNKPELQQARPKIALESNLVRVVTLNCAGIGTGPLQTVSAFEPDIIFLQEMQHPYRLRQIVEELYGGKGDYRFHKSNAIITRGKIEREVSDIYRRTQHLTTRLPDGSALELVNVHLPNAETRLDIWDLDCWVAHTLRRRHRRVELSLALQMLERSSNFPNQPAIVAGDFNAPASDAVYDLMESDFNNAFEDAGRGWGNTYHAKFPILRIDHIFATRHFTARSAAVIPIEGSDHKMVVTDLILSR